MPLNAPSVEATLITFDVEFEFGLPGEVFPEGVLLGETLPEEPLLEEDGPLQEKALIS